MRDLDELTEELHERGMRMTPQRQMIYALLADAPHHPTVDAVHDAVSDAFPSVSLRTVYQALHDLEELGEIRLAPVGGNTLRVDVRTDHHAHTLCVECGKVEDVEVDDPTLPRSRRHGFTVERTDITFSGHCATCRKAEPDSGMSSDS